MKDIFDIFNVFKTKNKEKRIKDLTLRIKQLEKEVYKEKNLNKEETVEKKTQKIELAKEVEGANNNNIKKELLSKEDILIKILKEFKEEQKTTFDIKNSIVDKQQLCSKASFYRYVRELKKRKEINSMKINNKEVLYSNNWEK